MEKHIYNTTEALYKVLAEKIINRIKNSAREEKPFHLALSGGRTPKNLFKYIVTYYEDLQLWDYIRFYWVDERCVPPDHPESNYKMTYDSLLKHFNLSENKIFRIRGENDPEKEAVRYGQLIAQNLPMINSLPCFDLLLLGMGTDGHIASIFPNQMDLFNSRRICKVAIHPETGQKRITLTGKVINNSFTVYFMVIGKNKAKMIGNILGKDRSTIKYPAALVAPVHGVLEWFLDDAAASYIK